jgi:hypothetical protein
MVEIFKFSFESPRYIVVGTTVYAMHHLREIHSSAPANIEGQYSEEYIAFERFTSRGDMGFP